ncbi:MAG: sensor histidine kinase, partial [Bacteroidota bacterium]
YSRDELIGKSAIDLGLYANTSERNNLIREIERNGVVQNHETVFRTKSGELRNALHSIGAIDVMGESILISMIVDITDRRRATEALEKSEEQYRKSSEQLRALAARLQSVREDEQTRIAREIHDELGQALTGLKMDLAWIERKWNDGSGAVALEKVRAMHPLIDETIRMVRRISSELRPGALDDLGLVAALEWQLSEFSDRTSIQSTFHSERENYDLDHERSTAIFRIFQESLTNIGRHSRATHIQVRLRLEKRVLVLEVQDNGRGITQAEIVQTTSLGLLGMRERAFVFNGSVDITGTAGAGTTLTVRIPLAS